MTRPPSPAQHARRQLNQVAMQRLHRRCESIRVLLEEESASATAHSSENSAPQSQAAKLTVVELPAVKLPAG